MITLLSINPLKRRGLTGLLGLSLDGSRLDGIVLRRANGSLQPQQTFSVALSLDPLTNDPELVGREIRNHLDAAGVRERYCAVCLPLKWALSTYTKLPKLPEADVASFLQIEAERGFPCDVSTLLLATSRSKTPAGEEYATLVGIPRSHIAGLEAVLKAAQLRPVSFSLGITALQPAGTGAADGTLTLAIGESQVGLQVTCGGGVASLRALEGALVTEGGQRQLHADLVSREVRITLGQLPAEFRSSVRRVRIFGARELAQKLADEIELRLEALDLKVELVGGYDAGEFDASLPPTTAVSPACSLAAAALAGRGPQFEFLPPKVTAWQQFAARYSSGKLRMTLTIAGGVALVVLGLFAYQQVQILTLGARWAQMQKTVTELRDTQKKIGQFRPWYDESFSAMTILKSLTEAFPSDGAVTAKIVEIRDLNTVMCSGEARDNRSLMATLKNLRAVPQITDVSQGPSRGQSPSMQFSFTFHWTEGAKSAGGSNAN